MVEDQDTEDLIMSSSGGGTASSSKSSDRSPGPSGKDNDPSPQSSGRNPMAQFSGAKKTKKTSQADKDKFKADRKTFVRNIKSLRPESGLSKIIKAGGIIPSILRNITDSKFNQDRRKKFMTDLDSLSKRFQTRRNINLPFGISFDANARTKNNLLQSLLAEAQEDLGLVAMSPGPFDYMNKRSIALSDLPKDRQDEIYDKVMDARMAGQTDAAGNLKAGFMFDGQGNIISTGNDGRDLEAEQLALLAQNQAAANAAASGDTDDDETPTGGLAFRFMADGGMPEDAPVGGIMDIESGRQMYFLGKLVKKATRAVKKVAKSPIGKAALFAGLAGAGGFGPLKGLKPMLFGTKGYFNIGSALHGSGVGKSIAGTTGLLGKLGLTKGMGSMALTGKGIGSIITAASLLPMLGLGTGDEDEDEAQEILRGSGLDIASIRNNPYTFTSSVGGTGLGRRFVADGGRIGFRDGTSEFMDFVRSMGLSEDKLKQLDINSYNAVLQAFQRAKEGQKPQTEEKEMAEGGKAEPVAKETMPLLKMGGKEMDLRDEGGFVPIGRMERADDVPARLSKNEFVFTADAVRNAGGGDIDKGAEVMYNMMQNLESGGEVSEESQGLKGAREMFQTSKRLEEVL